MRKLFCNFIFLLLSASTQFAGAWSLEEAAKPYSGTEVSVIFLDRPGYNAIIKLLPDFEKRTGIKIKYQIVPYENTREKEELDNLLKPAGLYRSKRSKRSIPISSIRILTLTTLSR